MIIHSTIGNIQSWWKWFECYTVTNSLNAFCTIKAIYGIYVSVCVFVVCVNLHFRIMPWRFCIDVQCKKIAWDSVQRLILCDVRYHDCLPFSSIDCRRHRFYCWCCCSCCDGWFCQCMLMMTKSSSMHYLIAVRADDFKQFNCEES